MNALDVFFKFLILGCMSFGGPVAHLAYFRKEFVERRAWLDESEYANLVALSQVLPGPGSSQVGFAIGIKRAGWLGGLAAFLGFTLPSFMLMFLLAIWGTHSALQDSLGGVLLGMKLLAVVVVADACLGMFNAFCKHRLTRSICVGAAAILLVFPASVTQLGLILFAGVISYFALSKQPTGEEGEDRRSYSRWSGWQSVAAFIFVLLLALTFWLPGIFSDFYQAGALVFGGGHVVLPLLQEILSGQLVQDEFLLGYASAQAIPGPMFTFASYLGTLLSVASPISGAAIATVAIFLPGLLLMAIFLGNWECLSQNKMFSRGIAGVNAAVVGILLSALYQPVLTSAVHGPPEMAAVLIGFWLLRALKTPVIVAVCAMVLLGVGIDYVGDVVP